MPLTGQAVLFFNPPDYVRDIDAISISLQSTRSPNARTSNSRRLEMRPSAPNPQPLTPDLQDNNEDKRPRANGRLDSKALRRAHLLRPFDLEIADDEASRDPCPVQPRGYLAGSVGVGVEEVGGDGGGGDHDAEDVETPAEGGDHVVVFVLEGEAEEDEAGDEEGGGDPEGPEARFGLETGAVAALVEGANCVVEIVAGGFAEDGGDDGGEVEVAWRMELMMRMIDWGKRGEKERKRGITYLFRTEVIERSEEDGQGGVDADDPGEGKDIIDKCQKDWYFDE